MAPYPISPEWDQYLNYLLDNHSKTSFLISDTCWYIKDQAVWIGCIKSLVGQPFMHITLRDLDNKNVTMYSKKFICTDILPVASTQEKLISCMESVSNRAEFMMPLCGYRYNGGFDELI